MYTAGEFAKKSGVTIRTIRYYDTKGLLKPSSYSKSNYRLYTDEDFSKLQKILALKELGFSLEEIKIHLKHSKHDNIEKSLELQKEAFEKKIEHMKVIVDAIDNAKSMLSQREEVDWQHIIHIINLLSTQKKIDYQFKDSKRLVNMINIHDKYSNNKEGWHQWCYRNMSLQDNIRILELGCGNGELWLKNIKNINKSNKIVLTDKSKGMIEAVKKRLGQLENIECREMNIYNIEFEDKSFDVVIANHLLGYIKDMEKALKEVKRVLKDDGAFFCTTVSREHLIEIKELATDFHCEINLSEIDLVSNFGLENGRTILDKYFSNVEKIMYDDYLKIEEPKDLIEYLYSTSGNIKEVLRGKFYEFEEYVCSRFKKKGGIFSAYKKSGMFISKK